MEAVCGADWARVRLQIIRAFWIMRKDMVQARRTTGATMRTYLMEFIATFFLVLTIGLAVVDGSPLGPLAIGIMLIALVYMGGHLSGAHYNPAVSLAFVLHGSFPVEHLLPYWIAQVAAAFAASEAVLVMTGETFALAPDPEATLTAAVLTEILFTFILMFVILNVARAMAVQGNSYYGVAIGSVVMGAAFVGGPISGAALNPAVGCCPILFRAFQQGGGSGDVWLYLFGPIVGAIAASFVFRITERKPDDESGAAS